MTRAVLLMKIHDIIFNCKVDSVTLASLQSMETHSEYNFLLICSPVKVRYQRDTY